MSEKLKSTIRHILTALGTLLVVFGLTEMAGLVDLITDNLDAVFNSIEVIIGLIMAIIGFFKDKERFAVRAEVFKIVA